MKRLLPVLFAAALMCSAAGCAALFDREYYTTEPYEALFEIEKTEEEGSVQDSISSYAALLRALTRLVEEHAESAQLQFQDYRGSISQDISMACWEVKSSTAVGAFAVDYMSYDLSRIVSYYQAEIHITYKRTEFQMDAIEEIDSVPALAERINEALREGETYLVLELTSAPVTADAVCGMITQAYYGDPMACSVLPSAEASSYPETGMDRIVEITIDYGMNGRTLLLRRQELEEACTAMLASAVPQETELRPDECVEALIGWLEGRSAGSGNTAYDALVTGSASSEGIAMALEAGCQAVGIDCQVVYGRLNNEPHYWNIITLDGQSYHADASNPALAGDAARLVGDGNVLSAGYRWDTSEYPECGKDFALPTRGRDSWRETEIFR